MYRKTFVGQIGDMFIMTALSAHTQVQHKCQAQARDDLVTNDEAGTRLRLLHPSPAHREQLHSCANVKTAHTIIFHNCTIVQIAPEQILCAGVAARIAVESKFLCN